MNNLNEIEITIIKQHYNGQINNKKNKKKENK